MRLSPAQADYRKHSQSLDNPVFASRPYFMQLSLKYSVRSRPSFSDQLWHTPAGAGGQRLVTHMLTRFDLCPVACQALEYRRAGMPLPSRHRKCRSGMGVGHWSPSTRACGDLPVSDSARDVSIRGFQRASATSRFTLTPTHRPRKCARTTTNARPPGPGALAASAAVGVIPLAIGNLV
jgi:hypothetical protein